RGYLQVLPACVRVPLANPAQSASQPRVAQRRIHFDGFVKKVQRFAVRVLRGQKITFQRNRLGVARRQLQRFLQRSQRLRRVSEAEFQLGDARPGEAEVRRLFGGRFGGQPRRFELGTRLEVIGFGHPLGGQARRGGAVPRLKLHRGDHFAQRVGKG